MMLGIGQPMRLHDCSRNCQEPCCGKGHGTVAAKVGAAGHLHPDAADVAEGFVQVTHADSLYTVKYRNRRSLSTVAWEAVHAPTSEIGLEKMRDRSL